MWNDFSRYPTLKITSGGLDRHAYFWSSDKYDYTSAYYWGLSNKGFDWDASGEMVIDNFLDFLVLILSLAFHSLTTVSIRPGTYPSARHRAGR